MGCKTCAERRKASLEKRRAMAEAKKQRLQAACDSGNQRACIELKQFLASIAYRGGRA